ncbi:MAG: IPT/TIG domain-containing protein [Solirubrobacteraceae bacterium]
MLAACCLAAALIPAPLASGQTMPQVTGLGANNGPQAGASTVTVRGVDFLGSSPVRAVVFDRRAAPRVRVDSDTEITVTTPPGAGEVDVRVTNSRGETSPPVAADRYAYDPPPNGAWLGLNGNSSRFLGPIDAFVEHHVFYDRSGPVEWHAGETLREGGPGLKESLDAGMIPVVTIEFRGYSGCSFNSECLPRSESAIGEYVTGFVRSGREMLRRYPAAGILLEAINEPWGYGSASQYAAILAQLLPAAARAGLPLAQIYAGASDAGWVQGLYEARPQLQTEVKGWYLHPYNRERNPGEGIGSLPGIQAEMTSGQNNLIVSEMGFCAPEVNDAVRQCAGGPAPAGSAAEAAGELTRELEIALPYHRAGWLRALLVYSRNDGGWAMQLTGGKLTESGRSLERFADAYG